MDCSPGFSGGSVVKNPPAMQEPQETCVRSLGWEDPLKEGGATHSSVLVWWTPWTGKPSGLQSMGGLKDSDLTEACPWHTDFSVRRILQARILEWIVIPFSRGSSQPRDQTHASCVSCTAGGFFTPEPQMYSIYLEFLSRYLICSWYLRKQLLVTTFKVQWYKRNKMKKGKTNRQ